MTSPSPRKVGKALPPIYVPFFDGEPIMGLASTYKWNSRIVRYYGYKYDRIVKYVPSLPRKAGARRGK